MRGKNRPEPVIPDHEVLRKIGGGSYGEVWLARGVTGAMRAVKLVRREDFEDEIGFEREFEGILKYEPISRDHPGLVNILHVGRSKDKDEGDFYYYVMELGDDIHEGDEFNPVEYEPRNLRTDLKQAKGNPIDSDVVINVGLRLAQALAHLHGQGLAHRDIKPSNIIFVGGKAKLADIGLVAARGQRTFVGTEGFVPPEGPGSARADIYGLGKVLYEMATGKDRLQFPELPDELPQETNKKRWLALNQVICDICEPRASKRHITTAKELTDSFDRLQRGQRVQSPKRGIKAMVLPLLVICLISVIWLFRDLLGGMIEPTVTVTKSSPDQYGYIKVVSDPEGAEVYDLDGQFMGITPLKNVELAAGSHYEFEFRMEGYRNEHIEGDVIANKTTTVEKVLSIYAPPIQDEEWVDNFGIKYQPADNYHISSGYVRKYQWVRFMQEAGQSYPFQVVNHSERGTKRSVVLVSAEAAVAYCDWQSQTALDGGYLSELEYIFPKMKVGFRNPQISNESKKKQWHPFRTAVMHIPFARIELSSEPEGALVQIDGQVQGVTPILIDSIKPGSVEVNLILEGYRRHKQFIQLKGRENKKLSVTMQRNNSVVFGQKWQNSLGMQLVPLAEDLLISVWETRKIDYLAFCKDSKKPVSPLPAFDQGPMHPVVNVSRVDADAFCAWLTEREQKLERISDDEKYRLLTDLEWSLAAGLDDNPDYLPSRREMRAEKTFPWGRVWPPEDVDVLVGNLSGKTASKAEDMPRERTLILYDDGYEKTSPVGMFSPNAMGIYDLAGNVSEWVSDDYAEDREYGVLRGGNWGSYLAKHLYVTSRNAVKSTKTGDRYGFRVVLAKKKPRLTNELQEDDALIQEP